MENKIENQRPSYVSVGDFLSNDYMARWICMSEYSRAGYGCVLTTDELYAILAVQNLDIWVVIRLKLLWRVSVSIPGWPVVDQAGLKLKDLFASAS